MTVVRTNVLDVDRRLGEENGEDVTVTEDYGTASYTLYSRQHVPILGLFKRYENVLTLVLTPTSIAQLLLARQYTRAFQVLVWDIGKFGVGNGV